jgi:hypothetical protein
MQKVAFQGPEAFSGIWECKISASRDLKRFLSWGMCKRSVDGGKNFLVSTAGVSILRKGIF